MVLGLVLIAEDSTTNNATDSTRTDQRGRAQRAFPLAADVVSLVGEHAGHVGIARDDGEEDAEVADRVIGGVAKKGKADDAQHSVKEYKGRADVVLVAEVGPQIHNDRGGGVGWGYEALCGRKGETHAVVEDDG